MIDVSEYSSKQELAEAMKFEQNCSILPVINSDIFKINSEIKKLETYLNRLENDKKRIENEINIFMKNNPNKTLIIERTVK